MPVPSRPLPIRIGLRYVKGLGERHWDRIAEARRERRFASVEDFVDRTALDEGTLMKLGESGAFGTLDPDRRSVLWKLRGRARASASPLGVEERERQPSFARLDEFETIGWDFRSTSHSTHGHPLEPLRDALGARGLPPASAIRSMKDGQRVRYAGMVICRQRPGTASGVVFMTLEDESGFVNVVVWTKVFERYALLIKTSSFLGVTGRLQVQDGVVHVIADSFWIPRVAARPESGGSRDFH